MPARQVRRALSLRAPSGLSNNRRPSSLSVDRAVWKEDPYEHIFVTGQPVTARVVYINEKGAVVSVENGAARGLVSMTEIEMYQAVYGESIRPGMQIKAHVARRLSIDHERSGAQRLALLLRPPVKERIRCTADVVTDALTESVTGTLPVGDKSSPREIGTALPGVSKSDFKRAVGQLLASNIACPDAHATYLLSRHPDIVKDRLLHKNAERNDILRKRKPLFQTGQGRTLFVGPVPRTYDKSDVAEFINHTVALDCVEAVKLALNKNGESKGYAFVLIYSDVKLQRVLKMCRRASIDGARVRVNEYSSDDAKSKSPPEEESPSAVEE